MNAGILSSMAGLLVREVWGSLEHRMKQRMHKARPMVACQALLRECWHQKLLFCGVVSLFVTLWCGVQFL